MNDYSWATATKELPDGRIAAAFGMGALGRLGVGPATTPVFDDEW